MSFRTFEVSGAEPCPGPEKVLEGLEALAFDGFSGEEGKARGWISLDHLLDLEFTAEKNFRGPFAVFGLRIDQRRVSPAIYKAHCAMELKATQQALGVAKVPLDEKRDIRRRIREQLLAETTPSSKSIGLAWNVRRRRLHLMSTSRAVITEVCDLMDRSFALLLEARTPTSLGLDIARDLGMVEAFNDIMPTALFADEMEGGR